MRLANILADLLRRSTSGDLTPRTLVFLSRATLIETLFPLAVGGLCLMGMILASQLFVTRFGFSAQKLTPNPAKLNPFQKIQGMVRENLTTFLQGLVLIPLLLYVVYSLFLKNLDSYLSLPRMSAATGSILVAKQIESLMWKASFAFLLLGFVDYAREKRRYMKGLRMTKQEIRDEAKEIEGNMEMKGRIKRLMRSLHRRRMLKNVPTATAVVVNPTHYAVALRYDQETGGAPIVVAKGKNRLALRIRAIATEHYIPIIENPPLARGLYEATEVGQEIPAHLYRAVAEILAHVFKLMSAYRPTGIRP